MDGKATNGAHVLKRLKLGNLEALHLHPCSTDQIQPHQWCMEGQPEPYLRVLLSPEKVVGPWKTTSLNLLLLFHHGKGCRPAENRHIVCYGEGWGELGGSRGKVWRRKALTSLQHRSALLLELLRTQRMWRLKGSMWGWAGLLGSTSLSLDPNPEIYDLGLSREVWGFVCLFLFFLSQVSVFLTTLLVREMQSWLRLAVVALFFSNGGKVGACTVQEHLHHHLLWLILGLGDGEDSPILPLQFFLHGWWLV